MDGFRTMVQLTLQHLFGMNYRPICPDCSTSEDPCQHMFGSSATAEGCIFGRVDAVYTSIEAQKSGDSLHAHSQVFLQCLHQHTTLWDIVKKLKADPGDIVKEYLECKAHACRQVYTSSRDEVDNKLEAFEKSMARIQRSHAYNFIPFVSLCCPI